MIALLGVGVVTAMTAVAEAAITVKGDTAAWKEIDAALTRLRALPGWRVKEIGSDGSVTREVEFAPPDYHITRRTPKGTFEIFRVGSVTVSRTSLKDSPAGAKCRRTERARQPIAFQDLKDFVSSSSGTGELTVRRKSDTSIGGAPVRAYTYLLQRGAGSATRGDFYIGAKTGLPRRSTLEALGGRTITRDYYDYGAKTAFTLPC
jgi:hypothetical protein